jgi:hypothetical protein
MHRSAPIYPEGPAFQVVPPFLEGRGANYRALAVVCDGDLAPMVRIQDFCAGSVGFRILQDSTLHVADI